MKRYRYGFKFKSNWEEVNLSDLLDDAKRMNLKQLSERYKLTTSTVDSYLKEYNVIPKNSFTGTSKNINDTTANKQAPDMTLSCGNVYPKNLYG